MKTKKRPNENPGLNEVLSDDKASSKFLVLHNDEVNSFDYVIETLIDVCQHDTVQAEQCTFIVHFKGKCEVKKGSLSELSAVRKELIKRGLTATID